MFAQYRRSQEAEEKKDVFAPVADLMVGVVFIFIILVLALSLHIMDDVQNAVPRSMYDEQKARAESLDRKLAEASKTIDELITQRDRALDDAAKQKDRADREHASRERLADFVRYVQSTGVVPVLGRLAEANLRRTEILEKLKERLSAGNIQVDIDDENGTLRLPSTNLFESAKADPTQKGKEVIRTLGIAIADIVPCFLVSRARPANCPPEDGAGILSAIYVEGHTDVAPFRSTLDRFRDNWDLSAARAIEAFKIVSAADQRISGLKNGEGKALVGVSGYAETRPVHEGMTSQERMNEQIRETDRRIEVRLVMAVDKEEVQATLKDLRDRLEKLDADLR
jgi:flagellar motor protein MotB